jgi:3-phenylpropionate/trans-cinnamate dioxygenase ferredoxin subunit
MVVVDVKGTRVGVANVQGAYYAFDDECTHEGCSLAEGDLAGTTVTCMCHGAEFDVRSGEVLAPPAFAPIRVYRTRVEGDALHIEI